MKTSSLKWLYPIFIFSIFIFFIPMQTLLLEPFKFGGIKPDLGLILSYLIGLGWGRNRGLFWGLLLGGVQDLFSIGFVGPHLVFKGLIGFGTGLLETFFLYFSLQAHAIVVFLISLIHDLLGEILFHGESYSLMGISYGMLGRGVYNSVIVMAIIFLVLKQSRLEEFLIVKGGR